jgi:hypothetical protein
MIHVLSVLDVPHATARSAAVPSETVDAIGYKADVPSRAKDKVSETVDNVKNKVSDTATRAKEAVVGTASRAGDAASSATSRVGEATPSSGEVKQQAKRAVGLAQDPSLPVGLDTE